MNDELQLRLRKIKGQIEGIEKMLAENRSCEEIIQQLQAVNSAIKNMMIVMIKNRVCQSLPVKKRELLIKHIKLLFKVQ